MQEGGVFFGKNQVRKADTGDCARRARTQDRKGGEVGLAVLATRAEPSVRGGAKGAKMDILARRWTKWHESGQFGRVRTCGTDIALSMAKTLKHVRLQKQAALLQSSMQNNYSYSSCKKRKLFNLN